MAGPVLVSRLLGLLLVSALPGVLGVRASPYLGAYTGHRTQVGLAAPEPRRQSPPKDQRERARVGALPWGALYTAAVVAFVLYKCLQQGKDEAAVLQEEESKKESLQPEQQLNQLTQQLVQTQQHLNNLMAQLDPLFESVTTLVGAQQELLNMKLQTIHQLIQACKTQTDEVPELGASLPFPEDFRIEENVEEAGDDRALEEPINWSTETWNLATSWQVEQGLRRRVSKAVTRALSRKEGRELKV